MPSIAKIDTAYYRIYSEHKAPLSANPTVIYNNSTYNAYGQSCVRTTNSVPSWRIRIAKRQDASSAYSVQRQTCVVQRGSCEATGVNSLKGWSARCIYNDVGLIPNSYPEFDSALSDIALTRLKRKLKKRVGSADALAPVAESRELRGLVRQASQMTTTLFETLIDIKRTKGKSALKYASNAWLAYGFGIRPLVDDTKAIAQAIADYFVRGDPGVRESASAKRDWVSAGNITEFVVNNGIKIRSQTVFHHDLSYRWWCGGKAELLSSNDYTLAKHLGFRSEALIPTFWELIPYSWAVDYFTTVGSFLEDVFWVLPGNLYYSGVSRRYQCRMHTTHTFLATSKDWVITPEHGSSDVDRICFERAPSGVALPTIGLRMKSLDEVGQYGVTKLLNLASVFMQRR